MSRPTARELGLDPLAGRASNRDQFDHTFCGVSHAPATMMVPEACLSLERCFEAIIDAGKGLRYS